MPRNEYLRKLQIQKTAARRRQILFTVQWCCDAAVLAANEVFHRRGEKLAEFAQKFSDYAGEIAALTLEDAKSDREMEYTKIKMDERLKLLLGDAFQPWDERYGL